MSNNTNTNTNAQTEEITNFALPVSESKKFEVPALADGVYNTTVKGVGLKIGLTNAKGEIFDALIWHFDINGQGIDGFTSSKLTTMSKAYSWVTAILGKTPELGKDFSMSVLVGKPCKVLVKNKGTGDNRRPAVETVIGN